MQQVRMEFLLVAETPIAHHAETVGNQAILQRRKVRQPDGSFEMVPCVSADTMRHGLREAAAYSFLDAAGLLSEKALTRAACRLLFAGGMVTGRGDSGAISLDRYREMTTLCPPLALLGGCADSRVIPGRLFVEDAALVCVEQEAFLPAWVRENQAILASCREHVEEQTRVRMDPLLNPEKRELLTAGEAVAATNQLTAGERAHDTDNAVERDAAKSTMLPRSFEAISQGSLFSWAVTCNCLDEIDRDTLHVMLGAFLYRPVVGGKRGTGHGRLRCLAAKNVAVLRPAEQPETVDPMALGPRSGERFRAHVAERRQQIKAWLENVDA